MLEHVTGSPFASGFGSPLSVSFSADGKLVAVAVGDGVVVFKVLPTGSLEEPGVFEPVAGADSVAFSPSGNFLATDIDNFPISTVEMFKVEADGTLVLAGTAATGGGSVDPDGLRFSPSGGLLATANNDNSVSVFEVGTDGTLTRDHPPFPTSNPSTSGNGDGPQTVAFGRGGLLLATGNVGVSPSTVSMFAVEPDGTLDHVTGSPFTIDNSFYTRDVAFSPTADLLAAGNADYAGPDPTTVSLFTLAQNGVPSEVAGSPFATRNPTDETDHMYGMAFSPSGGLLATGNNFSSSVSLFAVEDDPALRLLTPLPIATSNPAATSNGSSPYSVAFSPFGRLLATANQGGDSVSVFRPVGGFVISKSANVRQVHPGGVVRYTITVRPAGAAGGTGTVVDDLRDVLDSTGDPFDERASTGTLAFDPGTKQLVWTGGLGRGQTATITYSVRAHSSARGFLYNLATAQPGGCAPDPAIAEPCDTRTPIVEPTAPGPDLSLTKTASSATVHPGGQVLFTLAVHNHGPGDATGVTVEDPAPAALFLQTAHPSQGSCRITTRLVCRLGSVPDGGGALIQVSATIATDATGTIVNEAIVSGDQADPNPDNNIARSTIRLVPLPPVPGPDPGPQPISNLVVAKHVNHTTATRGQTLRYTVTVTNDGPDTASGVRLTDTSRLPLTVLSIHPSRGRCQTGPPLTCTFGTLGVGARVTITATATATATGSQINAAAATSTSWHPDPAASLAIAHTRITAPPTPPSFTG